MNRTQARQMYLSLDDKDFDDLARRMTRAEVKFWAMLALTFLSGALIGYGIGILP